MLVLTRKTNQRVIIGGTIELKVLEIGRRTVRLGFTVPAEIPVQREELRQRTAGADWNRAAAAAKASK